MGTDHKSLAGAFEGVFFALGAPEAWQRADIFGAPKEGLGYVAVLGEDGSLLTLFDTLLLISVTGVFGGGGYGGESGEGAGLFYSSIIGQQGGIELRITGDLPIGAPLGVYLGTGGDETDPPCYGGAGYGYFPESTDGVTLRCYSPPFAQVGQKTITVINPATGDSGHLYNAITVIEKPWRQKQFSTKACFPPLFTVGQRRYDGEDPL